MASRNWQAGHSRSLAFITTTRAVEISAAECESKVTAADEETSNVYNGACRAIGRLCARDFSWWPGTDSLSIYLILILSVESKSIPSSCVANIRGLGLYPSWHVLALRKKFNGSNQLQVTCNQGFLG